jgi:hypothetical protein
MAVSADFKPVLRPLEAFPIEQDGQQWIGLHDSTGFSPAQVALSPVAFFVISHFDGQHSIADVQAAFIKRFGQVVSLAQVSQLIRQLDEALLLESPRFAEVYGARVKAFLDNPVRPLREGSLPPAPQLEPLLRGMTQPLRTGGTGKGAASLAGLVAPHLDYPRGLPCYTTAYGTLASHLGNGQAPELIVILGTNHYGMKFGPVATDRDFETPFGRVASDRDAIRQLSGVYGDDLLAGQYDHLHEHSVELQVTVLARLLGAGRFRMAGFLLPDACEPTCQANLEKLASGLAKLAAERDGSMLIVAGADLSHIGSHFGDERPIEPTWLEDVAASDRAALAHLQSAQPEGFVEHLRGTNNATRVCSSGSLYVLRRALPRAVWQDLGYHQASDPESGTCVTCAAAALWG